MLREVDTRASVGFRWPKYHEETWHEYHERRKYIMAELPVSGEVLAYTEEYDLKHRTYQFGSGYCEKFQRLVVQSQYGNRFDRFWSGTATQTMEDFRGSVYCVWEMGPEGGQPDPSFLQAGDLLYKGRRTSGSFGHVGMVLAGGTVPRIGENSVHQADNPDGVGHAYGAFGWRYLSLFGPFEMVVRLSETDAEEAKLDAAQAAKVGA